MTKSSSLGRFFYSPIFRCAVLLLIALAWSSFVSCSNNHKAASSNHDTPLHSAAEQGDLAKVLALLTNNPNLVLSTGEYGMTPLHLAAMNGHKDVAELLLDNRAEVNAKNISDYTPLHFAALAGNKIIVELLLAHGADVNSKDNNGDTPLHTAAMGNKDVVELLLAHGADVSAKDDVGDTPLDYAIIWDNESGNKDVLELLRQHGGHSAKPSLGEGDSK
jgi:ankyrin repeat protein